jgi:hypothetical protein
LVVVEVALGAEALDQGKVAVEEEEGEAHLGEGVITVEANTSTSTIASTTGGVLMRRNSTLQVRQSSVVNDFVVSVRVKCSSALVLVNL